MRGVGVLFGMLLFCHCSPDDRAGVGGGSAGLAITVASTAFANQISGVSAGAKDHFLIATVGLDNVSDRSLPIPFALFAVQTASGLQIQSSALTGSLPNGCAADHSLAPAGTTTCALAFEVPVAEMVALVAYLDPMTGASATAPLPASTNPTQSTCEQARALTQGGSSACMSCYNSCNSGRLNGACTTTEIQCEVTCLMKAMTSGADPCTCEATCFGATCAAALQTNEACVVTTCQTACGGS